MQDKNKILLIFREKKRNGLDVCVALNIVWRQRPEACQGPTTAWAKPVAIHGMPEEEEEAVVH